MSAAFLGQFADADADFNESGALPSRVAESEPIDLSSEENATEDEVDSLAEDDEDLVYGADWEAAGGDFTKRFNRIKQHFNVASQTSTTSAHDPAAASSTLLPASNRRVGGRQEAHDGRAAPKGTHTSKLASSLAQLSHLYANRLSLAEGIDGAQTRKGGSTVSKDKDRSDRATNEQVLDPRTRLVLYKMMGRGLVGRIDGCVSTGKEANVYHAIGGTPEGETIDPEAPIVHLALKIYKTSILIFKDRDRYVTGEYRFKSGYARSNPRKMVRLWAEKELRNLRRLKAVGIRCPEAIEVRSNVLVMTFLGLGDAAEEWRASPRLKDAMLPEEQLPDLYIELLTAARIMYRRCRLVHADLSEYNVLYHDRHLWLIDVSQSVEHSHPHAYDFLRKDLENVDAFFARRGVRTLGIRQAFDLVALPDERPGMTAEDDLEAVRAAVAARPRETSEATDSVFARSYIPRTLEEVYDYERDAAQLAQGKGDDLIYAKLSGLAQPSPPAPEPSASSSESETGSTSDEDTSFEERPPRGKKFEDKDAKKARKQAAKEDAREKRTKKMKKSEKQRRIAKTSGKR